MAEAGHEIITLGMGNFATLTCAQYVNGMSRYESERNQTFMEQRGGKHVPRLLLLDAGHPSKIVEEQDLQHGGGAAGFSEDEVNEAIMNHVGNGGFYTGGGGYDDEEDDYEEGEDEITRRMRLNAINHHADPTQDQQQALPMAGENGEEVKVEVFQQNDTVVPWHLYIKTHLHARTYSHLHNIHRDPRAEGLLHSFGHGLHEMRPSRHQQCEDFSDNLRWMLEACDTPQGIQLFVDADGAFGGAAHNQINEFRDNFGNAIPFVAVPLFNPPTFSEENEFQLQRQQEVVLNEALTYSNLTDSGSLFVPMHVPSWNWAEGTDLYHNDPAVAQVIASTIDTGFYGARQEAFDDFTSINQYCALLRPQRSLAIVSALTSMPTRFQTKEDIQAGKPLHLWSVLEGNPLFSSNTFRPLSYATPSLRYVEADMANGNVYPFLDSRAQVLSHYIAMRGMGGLNDEVYPREEALLRYGFPVRTSSFRTLCTKEAFPISDTFPRDVLLPKAEAPKEEPGDATAAPTTYDFPMMAHLANTFACGPYLRQLTDSADGIVRRYRHIHKDAYGFESDEWREAIEPLQCLRDEYDRDGPQHDDDDDF